MAGEQRRAQAMVEYALISGLIAVFVTGVLLILGGEITQIFTNIANAQGGR